MKRVNISCSQMPGHKAGLANQSVISPRKADPEEAIIKTILVIIVIVDIILSVIPDGIGPKTIWAEGVIFRRVAFQKLRFNQNLRRPGVFRKTTLD